VTYSTPGTHKIKAIYSGDENSTTSTSLVLTLTITALPPI
jgi:hypothetical protein